MQPRMQEQQDKMNSRFHEGVVRLMTVFREIGYSEQEKTEVFSVSPLGSHEVRRCGRERLAGTTFQTLRF